MKSKSLLIVLLLILIILSFTACEHSTDFEEDGIKYREFDGATSVLGFVDEENSTKDLVIKGKTNQFPQYYVWAISFYAFENSDVETVTIEYYKAPYNVFHTDSSEMLCTFEKILDKAFKNCKQLREITFPKEMTTICVESFWGCESLKEVTFPWGLQKIEQSAFAQCSNLSVVHFDENFNFLGTNAFVNCAQQMTLYMKCPPPTVDGEAFSWGTQITVVVPQQLFEVYSNHEYWGKFDVVAE